MTRRVRTTEGSRYYGLPIGSPIIADPPVRADRLFLPEDIDEVPLHIWDEIGAMQPINYVTTPYGDVVSDVPIPQDTMDEIVADLETVVKALPPDVNIDRIDVVIPQNDPLFKRGPLGYTVQGRAPVIHLHPMVAKNVPLSEVLDEMVQGTGGDINDVQRAYSLATDDDAPRLGVMMHESGHLVDFAREDTSPDTFTIVRWLLALADSGLTDDYYAMKDPFEGYAEFYADYRLSPNPNPASLSYAERYRWDGEEPTKRRIRAKDGRPIMADLYGQFLATAKKILDTAEVQEKVRHVRDAAYWGLPVGTPIEPGMKPVKPGSPDAPDLKPSTTTTRPSRRITPTTTATSTAGEWLTGDDKPDKIVMPGGRPEKDMIVKGRDSLWKHLEYNPTTGETRPTVERQQFWRGIIEELRAGVSGHETAYQGEGDTGDFPVFTMLGGGGGSGKSRVQQQADGLTPKDDTVRLDADDIKAILFDRDPEYQHLSKDDRARFLHEESSLVVKMAQKSALGAGQHVLLDGTGNSDLDKLEKKIKTARDAGYQVNGVYATVPTQLAWARNVRRALIDPNRGEVPPFALGGAHASVSDVAPQAAPDFDHFQLFDMASGQARLIATCERGGEMEIIDQAAYDGFLSKAGTWSDAELEALRKLIPQEYLDMPDDPTLDERDYLGPEWFDYGWMPSLDTKAEKMMLDDDVKTTILISVGRVSFEQTGLPDTPEIRDYWAATEQSLASIPEGVGVDVPKEWPSEEKYGAWLEAWGM